MYNRSERTTGGGWLKASTVDYLSNRVNTSMKWSAPYSRL